MKKNNPNRGCPSCLAEDGIQLGEKGGYILLSCRKCQSIYSSHLPVGEEIEDYSQYYDENTLNIPEFIFKRLDEIIDEFQPHFTHGRLLDIGFGAATLMTVAKEKGWKTYGVEVSKPAIDYAQKLGFEVFHGELQDARFPDNHFDVITASEIIEHCPQPEILLNEIVRILRPGGLFWATTPSAKGLSYQLVGLDWTTICPPEHLQLFSKKGVSMMLKKAGFSTFKIQASGFNPFEIINTSRARFKGKEKNQNQIESFNPLETSYAMNESLTKSPVRQKIKNLLNQTLNILSIGDTLKINAVK